MSFTPELRREYECEENMRAGKPGCGSCRPCLRIRLTTAEGLLRAYIDESDSAFDPKCEWPPGSGKPCLDCRARVFLGARAHAILTDEENAKLKAALTALEAERDEAKRHAVGQHRALTKCEEARDHARRRCEEAWAEGGKLGRALQAAREALEEIERLTTRRPTCANIRTIAGRALKAMGMPGEGTFATWGCEKLPCDRKAECERNRRCMRATPAAPMCPTCRGRKKVFTGYGDETLPCPSCTTPTPTEETPR